MTNFNKTLMIITWIMLYSSLVIFSYAFVDLNLTLSQNSAALSFIHTLQILGFYNRPLSTIIFISLLLLLFCFFTCNLIFASQKKLTFKFLFKITIIITFISIFAYPFLSSDLFNYIFDAKIILHYHLSPYSYKALDFPADDWIRFMRWTHRYSPYGPLWLAFSLIPAFLGFGKFLLNLFMFKIFIGLFHIINTYIIYSILEKTDKNKAIFFTTTYALNPLFLIEGVINAHNDVLLATFLLLSVYFFIIKNKLFSISTLVLGFFIKYIPVLNLPWVIYSLYKKDNNYKSLIILNLITLAIFTYVFSTFSLYIPFISKGSTQVQFQPWYLFWTLPYITLVRKKELTIVAIILSAGALLRYIPFLYYGDWTHKGTINFMQIVTVAPALIAALLLIIKNYFKEK